MKKNYPVFIEEEALAFDKIFVNAGKRGLLMGINPNDLAVVCGGEFVGLV